MAQIGKILDNDNGEVDCAWAHLLAHAELNFF